MLKMVWLDTAKTPKKLVAQLENCLRKFGKLSSYPNTNSHEVAERALDAEVLLVNKVLINAEHLQQLPKLKYIIVIATGYDNVDVNGANKLGILVSNIPDYSTLTVAQHTIALLLELTNQVGTVSQNLKTSHKWLGGSHNILELSGLTLGVIGFGQIARSVDKIAVALGMKVIVASGKISYVTDLPVNFVSHDTLYKTSDVISLHCPLTSMTYEMINSYTLGQMKSNILLINTSRGGLINHDDLYKALKDKQIAGAALDVLALEPPSVKFKLNQLDNCIITPHIAWASYEAMNRILDICVQNIEAYIDGRRLNVVNLFN